MVADEVRNLALRSAEAAKVTADLIAATVKKVQDGADMVAGTNQAFIKVAESTSKAGELIGEIAAASKEQAQGIEQVNHAVADMDKVTQQNAAGAEETSSIAEDLNTQAEQIKVIVEGLAVLVGGSTLNQDESSGKYNNLQMTAPDSEVISFLDLPGGKQVKEMPTPKP